MRHKCRTELAEPLERAHCGSEGRVKSRFLAANAVTGGRGKSDGGGGGSAAPGYAEAATPLAEGGRAQSEGQGLVGDL